MNSSPSQTIRRSRARWCFAALGAILAISVWGYQTYVTANKQAELLAEWQAEVKDRQRLDKVVSMHFGQPVALREWLAEFTRQTGMPVEFKNGVRIEPSPQLPWEELSPELPVWVDLPPMPARDALETLCELVHVNWGLQEDRIEFNLATLGEPMHLQMFPLPPELRTNDLQEFDYQAQHFSRFGDWDYNGDPRWSGVAPAGFAALQPDRGHRRMAQFLARLANVCRRAEGIPPAGLAPDDPAWEPMWLGGEPEQLRKLERALEQPITLRAESISFRDLVVELRRQAKFPIVVSPEALVRLGPLTCDLKQVPLQDLLQELSFDPLRFEFVPVADCQALAIVPREVGDEFHHQIVLAWPVSDLAGSQDLFGEYELATLLGSAIDLNEWNDWSSAEYQIVHRGRVLIVAQRLAAQQRIKELFAAMRKVRSGAARQVAWEPTQPQPMNPAVVKQLQTPVALQCAGLERRFALQHLLESGQITLGMNYGNLEGASNRVWCYLPPRPLRANLELFFRSGGDSPEYVNYATLPGVEHVELLPPLSYAVFDLRPWLLKRSDQPDLASLLTSTLDSDHWSAVGGHGNVVVYQDQLIASCEPELLGRVQGLLAAIEQHLQPGPKQWRGKLLAGDELNEPLDLKFPAAASSRREERLKQENQAIESKLLRKVTTHISSKNLGEAILELAKEHELPLILHQPAIDLHVSVGPLEVRDQPLGELLQTLIGETVNLRWLVRDGYLTLADPAFAAWPADWFSLSYSVDDLIVPRGKLLPKQLVRTLETAIQNNDLEAELGGAWVYFQFGNILSKSFHRPEPRAQEMFEQLLRDIRSGKLKPVPAEKGDRDFLEPPFRPFVNTTIPIVGQMPNAVPTY